MAPAAGSPMATGRCTQQECLRGPTLRAVSGRLQGGLVQRLKNGRASVRFEGCQGIIPFIPLAFTRGYIKNGLYMIKSVIFMARRYGKTIKLAEHRNERILNILGSPTGTEKEQSRLQTERHLNRFKIRSSIPPSLLSPAPGGPAQLKGSTAGVSQLTLTQGAWNIPAGASLGDGRAAQGCPLPHTSLPGGFLYRVIATPPLPPWTLTVTSQWARKYKTDCRSHSRLSGQVDPLPQRW